MQPWHKRTPPWSLATIGVARHCGDQSLPRFDLSAALIASIKRSAVISQTYDTGSWRQGHQGWPPPHGEAIKSGRAGELEDFLTRHNGANKVTLISYWPLVTLSNSLLWVWPWQHLQGPLVVRPISEKFLPAPNITLCLELWLHSQVDLSRQICHKFALINICHWSLISHPP